MTKIIITALYSLLVVGHCVNAAEYVIASGICLSTYLIMNKHRSDHATRTAASKQLVLVNNADRAPIFYRPEYNMFLLGQKIDPWLHPFDGGKYGKVAAYLKSKFYVEMHQPQMVADTDLSLVHTSEYLKSLSESSTIVSILEVPLLRWLPAWFLTKRILNPMRYATQGTIKAVEAAVERGWAINLGGGYHHAKKYKGEGLCAYADIPIAIAKLHQKCPSAKVLIVDTDAHLGNGNAQIKRYLQRSYTKQRVYIFDMYNRDKYPCDNYGIGDFAWNVDYAYDLRDGVNTESYLEVLTNNLPRALDEVEPGLIIYNAGTDVLAGDLIGGMDVSAEGITKRDEFVFNAALTRNIPIVMTLSGGYTKESAGVISRSIENILKTHKLVPEKPNEH